MMGEGGGGGEVKRGWGWDYETSTWKKLKPRGLKYYCVLSLNPKVL